MTRLTLAISVLVLPLISSAAGFRHYKDLPDKEIDVKTGGLDPDAILEMGYRSKKAVIPRLKNIAGRKTPDEAALKAAKGPDGKVKPDVEKRIVRKYEKGSRAARMALAKLGEPGYVDEFIGELNEKGKRREEAISALGYIGDRKTAKYLAEVLSDESVSDVKRSSHELATPYSYQAELALGEMFPEVLDDLRKKNPGNRFFFKEEWKKWWQQNKSKYK